MTDTWNRSIAGHSPTTWLRWSLWPLMLGTGVAAESFVWRGGLSPQYIVYDLTIGFVTAFLTLVIWEANPRNIVGPLLFLWAAWFVLSPVRSAHVTWVVCVSVLVDSVSGVFFGHAMLSYPNGRLTSRLDRAWVIVGYALSLGTALLQLLFAPIDDLFGGDLAGCTSHCLTKPPLIAVNRAVTRALQVWGDITLPVFVLAFTLLMIRRYRRAAPRERRLVLPALVVAVGTGLSYVAQGFMTSQTGGAWQAEDIISHARVLAVAVVIVVATYATRVQRAQVADMLSKLRTARPEALQPMLAAVLRDPQLRLLLADQGRVPELPPGRISTPIRGEAGTMLATLWHDDSVLEDKRLLASVIAATAMALENSDLQTRLRAQLDEVRASRARLVHAGDAERRRLERNLHDGAQQRLLSLGLALQLAQQQARVANNAEVEGLLAEARQELIEALVELREIARGINPAVLADQGLATAVQTLANRCSVPVRVAAIPSQRLPTELETTAYYVVSEALQNVSKYAQAKAASVRIDQTTDKVRIEVVDDGIGGAAVQPGGGLHGLRDRVEAVAGSLTVTSPDSQGTQVVVELPCASY